MKSDEFFTGLSKEIILNDHFREDYTSLLSPDRIVDTKSIPFETVKRLAESAAIFGSSSSEVFRRIALRIASSLVQDESKNDVVVAASQLVLLRIGDFPLLRMAFKQGSTDYYGISNGGKGLVALTPSVAAEISHKELKNRVTIAGEREYLTDFQSEVYQMLSMGKNLSVSAPTSAGKTYLLTRFLIGILLSRAKLTAVYIVPTRALISEIQRELRRLLHEHNMEGVEVLTTSWEVLGGGAKDRSKSILVLTPERLQTILGRSNRDFKVDLLIVDEAQRIEESARGIVLEESVQNAINLNPGLQVIFISPHTENPEKLGSIFLPGRVTPYKSDLSPVAQNMYIAEWHEQTLRLACSSRELGAEIDLAEFQTDMPVPSTQAAVKAWMAVKFISSRPTMVYCNTPGDCRNTCNQIAGLLEARQTSVQVDEVIRFLRRYVHPDYFLADFLEKRIGYHYGPMLPSIRMMVESLFSDKQIDLLCCTSTLAAGVNFPARNIVIHKPKSGRFREMDRLTFMNLVGRAGRLNKDFEGNVYCINPSEWSESCRPQIENEGHEIRSSMEEVIRTKKSKIVEHLKSHLRVGGKDEDVEAAVTRFIISEIRNENKEFVGDLLRRNEELKREDLDNIVRLVRQIVDEIELAPEVIVKNGSIDPRLQNRLYIALKKNGSLPQPAHPFSDGFYEGFTEILSIISQSFGRDFKGKARLYSLIGTLWVEEKTFGEIVRRHIEFLKKTKDFKETKENVNSVIENLIDIINNQITYRICRDVTAYTDIIKKVLDEKGASTEIEEKLGYYLEMGASRPTTLTLMENGIPRTAAILISRRLPPNIQEFDECIMSIKKMTKDLRLEIPSVLYDKIFTSSILSSGSA